MWNNDDSQCKKLPRAFFLIMHLGCSYNCKSIEVLIAFLSYFISYLMLDIRWWVRNWIVLNLGYLKIKQTTWTILEQTNTLKYLQSYSAIRVNFIPCWWYYKPSSCWGNWRYLIDRASRYRFGTFECEVIEISTEKYACRLFRDRNDIHWNKEFWEYGQAILSFLSLFN